jgi:hypothetical protein
LPTVRGSKLGLKNKILFEYNLVKKERGERERRQKEATEREKKQR